MGKSIQNMFYFYSQKQKIYENINIFSIFAKERSEMLEHAVVGFLENKNLVLLSPANLQLIMQCLLNKWDVTVIN